MPIDVFSFTFITMIVVLVSAVLYIFETLVHRDSGAPRVWSVAFLAGVLAAMSYVIWSMASTDTPAWLAVGVGNASLAGSMGAFWIGCLRFNGRRLAWAAVSVGVGMITVAVSAWSAGPGGGDWAGAIPLFVGVSLFAGFGAVESRRFAMGSTTASIGLTVALAVTSLYYLLRLLCFVTLGPDSALFMTWLGNVMTAVLTVILTIVAVVATSVLRAGVPDGRVRDAGVLELVAEGILDRGSFRLTMESISIRARLHSDLIGVIALSLDDLPKIGTAFGAAEQENVASEWRAGVRRYAPIFSIVGEHTPTVLVVGFQATSVGDARRIASRIHRRVLDDFAAIRSAVVPVIGVGVALSDVAGYQVDDLVSAAMSAAEMSASSSEASVMITGGS